MALAALPVDARDFLPSVTARSHKKVPQRPLEVPSDDELEKAGASIGSIEFDNQEIFTTDQPDEDFTLFRIANALHIQTRRTTIERQLLFRAGDRYSRQRIEESERLLRAVPYLIEARIVPIAYRDGRVDVRVSTRDVWTLKPGVSLGRSGGTNRLGVGIEESNLLGYGKALALDYTNSVDRTTTVLDFRDPNLFGTRWTLAAQLGRNSDGRRRGLAIEHPFYSLDSRWSAGMRLVDDQRIDPIYDLGNRIDEYQWRQRGGTAFLGRSDGLQNGRVTRWTAGITYDDLRFVPTAATVTPGLVPASRRLVYPWLRHEQTEDRFVKLENVDQIGRIEDMNLGWQTSVQIGLAAKAWHSDRNALIWESTIVRRLAINQANITELKAGLSGRLESARIDNGRLSLSARHSIRQSTNVRTLISLQADAGVRLDADQPLTLGGDSGLRGYPLRYQAGSGRALLTIEQRYFTDWYPFRLVRMGGAIFADMGRTWGDNPLGTRSIGLLRDFGFGLRIGHTRSGLGNVTHVNLAFPIDARGDIRRVQFIVETKSSF